MSVSRSLGETTGRMGLLQWVRLGAGFSSLVLALLTLAWGGVPQGLNVRAVAVGGLLTISFLSFLTFCVRAWPAHFVTLSRWAQRFEPNRRLTLTRDGKILIAITFAVGLAATNTGNNFLYLVMGMLFAIISISGILSEWTLRGVTTRITAGGERFAGQPGLVHVEVANHKGRLSTLGVEVSALLRPPHAENALLLHRVPPRVVLHLPAGGRDICALRCDLPTRGVWEVAGFEVATAYPFGFFRKSKNEVPERHEPTEVLVYPLPVPVTQELAQVRLLVGERPGERAGQGDEFHALRHHRTGEDVRRVAWKRSARTGRLMVRENEEPRGRVVTLVVPGHVPGATAQQRADYETCHQVAAGLVLALLERGDEVGVVAGSQAVPPMQGSEARTRLLEALARARLEDPLADLPAASLAGSVLGLEGPGTIPAAFALAGRVRAGAPRAQGAPGARAA